MWQIRLYDGYLALADRWNEMELIKEVETDLGKWKGLLEINEKVYKVCWRNYRNRDLGVKEIKMNPEPEEQNGHEFVCPYCRYHDDDSWELDDNRGIEVCDNCGSEVEYKRYVTVTYTTKPVKQVNITKID